MARFLRRRVIYFESRFKFDYELGGSLIPVVIRRRSRSRPILNIIRVGDVGFNRLAKLPCY